MMRELQEGGPLEQSVEKERSREETSEFQIENVVRSKEGKEEHV